MVAAAKTRWNRTKCDGNKGEMTRRDARAHSNAPWVLGDDGGPRMTMSSRERLKEIEHNDGLVTTLEVSLSCEGQMRSSLGSGGRTSQRELRTEQGDEKDSRE